MIGEPRRLSGLPGSGGGGFRRRYRGRPVRRVGVLAGGPGIVGRTGFSFGGSAAGRTVRWMETERMDVGHSPGQERLRAGLAR